MYDAGQDLSRDGKTTILQGLSALEMCLLVAMKHLGAKGVTPYACALAGALVVAAFS